MAKEIRRIIFLGPQGSGKGTQAEMLAAKFKIPVISTGEIYRQEAHKKTVLGEQISGYMHQGKLVPDDITNALIEKRLNQKDCQKGFVLDGYPRTIAQAEALQTMVDLTDIILIDITDREAISRIAGRLVCKCGAIYHLKFKPPVKVGVCDKCGQALAMRKDDSEELALRKRLQIYHEQIDPIIDFYEQRHTLHRIDGRPSIAEVAKEVDRLFTK